MGGNGGAAGESSAHGNGGKAIKPTPKPYVKMIYKSRGIAAIRSTFGEKKQVCQVGGKHRKQTSTMMLKQRFKKTCQVVGLHRIKTPERSP